MVAAAIFFNRYDDVTVAESRFLSISNADVIVAARSFFLLVGGGRSPQSGPRLDTRVLRQSALEELTNFARTESPRQGDRNKSDHDGGGTAAARRRHGGTWRLAAERWRRRGGAALASTCVTLNGSGIQLAVGPQPLRLRNHNFGLAHRIMVKHIATSPHDPLGIIDSACKNQLVVVSVQYGPFNTYIPIRSTTIGKSRVAIDLITMHTSWRSNSDIASVTRQPIYLKHIQYSGQRFITLLSPQIA
ncbi:hypothetical protein F511_38125 [Dorcoceras hygrometricum]|uniref:Uncharacterized protein n=1 Tax=Dorcoceras hygrometricum TaxID=472368 RepID=A0A2Z7BMT1_9LAMI|nr:hypothetical protein F511_38125 [Dorcoceras hygrometricum]